MANLATIEPANQNISTLERTMPHNFEAEQGLLGALMLNNSAFERVADFLDSSHFADGVHGRIFEAIKTLIDRGHIANPVTLKNYFDQDDSLQDVGGAQYLKDLVENVVGIINVYDYAKAIHEMFQRRKLINIGEEVVNNAYLFDLENPTDQQIEQAEKRLYELATSGEFQGGFKDFDGVLKTTTEMIEHAYKRDGELLGLPTGLKDLDQMLGGLHKTDLVILAARPSMGKTALATNLAYNVASQHLKTGGKKGGVVGFFSLEMSAEQLANRILAEQVEIPSDKLRRGQMNKDDMTRLLATSREMAKTPIYIDDTPALTVSSLRTRARRLKRQHGLDFIVVDYLQLLNTNNKGNQSNRVQEISEITRGLKTLAKELGVPVLALSQLSRQVESRDDKRPHLADLRESGSIEQDADVVMFIYRENYYLSREGEPVKKPSESQEHFEKRDAEWRQRNHETANLAEVIIAKQRHGAIGTVKLHFNAEITKFSNHADQTYYPEAR